MRFKQNKAAYFLFFPGVSLLCAFSLGFHVHMVSLCIYREGVAIQVWQGKISTIIEAKLECP